jgi:hypothetical protein
LSSLPDIKLPEIDIQGATLAMGIAKVLEGMRGMFIEVAKDEAQTCSLGKSCGLRMEEKRVAP